MIRFFLKLFLSFCLLVLVLLFYSLYEPKVHQWFASVKTTLGKATDVKPVAKVREWTKEHLPGAGGKEKSTVAHKPIKVKPRTLASKSTPQEHITNEDRQALEHLIPEQ